MTSREPGQSTMMSSFSAMLSALTRPEAFLSQVNRSATIEVRHTHASAVLLTDVYAYKLKKPLNLGFLDYSTPERRRACCLEEYAINQPLAPGVYVGIAPVLRDTDGAFSIGSTMSVDTTPTAGARQGSKVVVDFAVVMRRLPDTRSLAALLTSGQVDNALIEAIAERLARFHSASDVARADSQSDPVSDLLANIKQTVDQATMDIGTALNQSEHTSIAGFIERFSARRRPLLEARLHEGRERNGHGDVRLEHVYINPWGETADATPPEIVLVDRIEFDARYRIGDVAGEVTFLEVELEAVGRADLARTFVRAYVAASGDTDLLGVAPFYRVYRSLVRGKVRALYATQQHNAAAHEEARTFYELAARFATCPAEAHLVIIGGLMGSGKSTLARTLGEELGWTTRSSDVTRKRLAGLSPAAPVSAADQDALYTPAWDRRVYRQLANYAASSLRTGRSIILDASFISRARRRMFTRLAADSGARAIFIECVCPRDVALERLQARWDTKTHQSSAQDEFIFASDGRPELYEYQARRWEAFSESAEPGLRYATIDTTLSSPRQLEYALQSLAVPHSSCFLLR